MLENVRILVRQDLKEQVAEFANHCPHLVDLWDNFDSSELENNDIDALEQKIIDWIEENTKEKVFCTDDLVFYFESEIDVVAFKLRWM